MKRTDKEYCGDQVGAMAKEKATMADEEATLQLSVVVFEYHHVEEEVYKCNHNTRERHFFDLKKKEDGKHLFEEIDL